MVDGAIGLCLLLNGRPLRGCECWPHYSPGGGGDNGNRVNGGDNGNDDGNGKYQSSLIRVKEKE